LCFKVFAAWVAFVWWWGVRAAPCVLELRLLPVLRGLVGGGAGGGLALGVASGVLGRGLGVAPGGVGWGVGWLVGRRVVFPWGASPLWLRGRLGGVRAGSALGAGLWPGVWGFGGACWCRGSAG